MQFYKVACSINKKTFSVKWNEMAENCIPKEILCISALFKQIKL